MIRRRFSQVRRLKDLRQVEHEQPEQLDDLKDHILAVRAGHQNDRHQRAQIRQRTLGEDAPNTPLLPLVEHIEAAPGSLIPADRLSPCDAIIASRANRANW